MRVGEHHQGCVWRLGPQEVFKGTPGHLWGKPSHLAGGSSAHCHPNMLEGCPPGWEKLQKPSLEQVGRLLH